MNIDVKKLLFQEGLEFTLQGKTEIPLLKENFQGLTCEGPVHYDLLIQHQGQGKLTVKGALHATFRGQCVHCLDTALIPLEAVCDELFLPSDARKSSQDDAFEAFKEEHYYYTTQLLELDKMISDQFLPLLPLVVSCKDDCKGLCHQCGENLNQKTCSCVQDSPSDEAYSPFAALLKLKFD